MTVAFAIAGIAQVYLERRMGMDFLAVQEEIEVHFLGLVLAATVFAAGIVAYVINFVRSGLPVGEVDLSDRPIMADSTGTAPTAVSEAGA